MRYFANLLLWWRCYCVWIVAGNNTKALLEMVRLVSLNLPRTFCYCVIKSRVIVVETVASGGIEKRKKDKILLQLMSMAYLYITVDTCSDNNPELDYRRRGYNVNDIKYLLPSISKFSSDYSTLISKEEKRISCEKVISKK